MRTFRQRVAVVTGGASGLGLALAHRLAREGVQLMLADVDEAALDRARAQIAAGGASVVTHRTDVSQAAEVEALARATIDRFGAVHIVCNNAGVAPLGAAWESSLADWQWALGVNVWGVIHGVRVFTPILLDQADEGHIVNTASVAGLISPPGMAVYNVTKHAVVALSETLQHDLAVAGAKVRCSVVCPAYFPSGIADSERRRPDALRNETEPTAHQEALAATLRKAVSSGKLTAEDIAARIFDAIRDERFYVLTHPAIKGAIEARMQDILGEANPRNPLRLR